MSTQLPSHWVCPAPHAPEQTPSLQISPSLHELLQPPQWSRSVVASTQIDPQTACPTPLQYAAVSSSPQAPNITISPRRHDIRFISLPLVLS
jgi:hypothetical protein